MVGIGKMGGGGVTERGRKGEKERGETLFNWMSFVYAQPTDHRERMWWL